MPKTNPHLRAFRAGDRVQAHPATDAWMQGDHAMPLSRSGGNTRMSKWTRAGAASALPLST